MKTEYEEAILRVVPDVMEKMAFMFADPADKENLCAVEDELVSVRMTFSGPFNGELDLVAPVSICPSLAENILGEFNEENPEKAYDALKEVLNVICGNLLIEIAGEQPVFDLTVPQISPVERAEWDIRLQDPDVLAFQVEDQPLLFSFQVK